MTRDPDGFPAFPESEGAATTPGLSVDALWPSRDDLRRMTPAEVNRFLASRGVSIRVRDDELDRPTGEMAVPDEPEPMPPVPRRPWGCVGAVLVSVAVWVLFIAVVVRVVGR